MRSREPIIQSENFAENDFPPLQRSLFVSVLTWILVWSLVAFLLASYQVASRPLIDGKSITWTQAVQLPIILSFFWGMLSPFIFGLTRRFPVDRKTWPVAIGIHLAVASLMSLVFILICATLLYVIVFYCSYSDSLEIDPEEFAWWNLFLAFSRSTFHSSMLIYFAIAAVGQTLDSSRKLREREILASQLKADLVSAQFDQLRAQLHPHFLFNTLSAITTFVDKDPPTAKNMIVRLSDLLRVVVDEPSIRTRQLQDELEFLRRYVEIQTVRFGDKLIYEEQIDPQAMEIQIPFLLFQPLVENAIKHGVCETSKTCVVKLSVQVAMNKIHIVVSDTGPGNDLETLVEGVGLSNTRSRLQHLYDEDHEFNIECDSKGFFVRIVLPIEGKEQAK